MNILLLSGYLVFNTLALIGAKPVYICNNKHTKKYHYSATCKGLSNCKYKLLKSTEAVARNQGMSLCGWEK
jgi:hypothetical protein